MHEHLTAGFAGFEANTHRPGQSFDERVAVCIEQIHQLRDLGFTSMLDPCPNDLGRDVELMAKVSQDTRFNIVFATGLYKESASGSPYWKYRANFGGDQSEPMAELFIHEITNGVGDTGIKAGIIKVASDAHRISDYEMTVLQAAHGTEIGANKSSNALPSQKAACPTSDDRRGGTTPSTGKY